MEKDRHKVENLSILIVYVMVIKKIPIKSGVKKTAIRMDHCILCKGRLSAETCVLPCNHVFCKRCISKSTTHSQLCPQCGEPFSRLQEEINHRMTGYVFSAKALSKLYSLSAESSDVFGDDREQSERHISRSRVPTSNQQNIAQDRQRSHLNRITMQPTLRLE